MIYWCFRFHFFLDWTPAPALDWLGITVPAASARHKTQSDNGTTPRRPSWYGRDDHLEGEDAAGVVVLPEIASAGALLDKVYGGEVAAFQQQRWSVQTQT